MFAQTLHGHPVINSVSLTKTCIWNKQQPKRLIKIKQIISKLSAKDDSGFRQTDMQKLVGQKGKQADKHETKVGKVTFTENSNPVQGFLTHALDRHPTPSLEVLSPARLVTRIPHKNTDHAKNDYTIFLAQTVLSDRPFTLRINRWHAPVRVHHQHFASWKQFKASGSSRSKQTFQINEDTLKCSPKCELDRCIMKTCKARAYCQQIGCESEGQLVVTDIT